MPTSEISTSIEETHNQGITMSDEQQPEAAEMPERANERIQSLIAERKSLAQQLEESRALATAHESPLTELRSRYEAEAQGWTQQRAFLGAGITDADTQEVILQRYGKLGEDAPELSAWLAEGAGTDPIVSRLLAPAAAPASTRLPADTGAQPTPAVASSGSREDYMRQLQEVQRMRRGPTQREALERLKSHPYLTGG